MLIGNNKYYDKKFERTVISHTRHATYLNLSKTFFLHSSSLARLINREPARTAVDVVHSNMV